MDTMLCPHGCGVTFDRNAANIATQMMDTRKGERHVTLFSNCPRCEGLAIELVIQHLAAARS